MPNLTQREPSRSGVGSPARHTASDDTPRNNPGDDVSENDLPAEVKRMAAEQGMRARAEPSDGAADVAVLRAENAELRGRVDELEQMILQLAEEGGEQAFAEKQREFEAILEEKSEVIRELHRKLQELESVPEAAPPRVADKDELAQLQQQLAELQQQLEEERQQLKDDEESLMRQMREMELAMARDRAELARQRTELQRLHNDLNREVEQASRDSGLRERLLLLSRRTGEVVKAKAAAPAQADSQPAPDPAKKGSGLLRRLFGG